MPDTSSHDIIGKLLYIILSSLAFKISFEEKEFVIYLDLCHATRPDHADLLAPLHPLREAAAGSAFTLSNLICTGELMTVTLYMATHTDATCQRCLMAKYLHNTQTLCSVSLNKLSASAD